LRLFSYDIDDATRESIVILERKGKKYTGKAKARPDDDFSFRFGLNIAEKRAELVYWKERRNINRIKKQAITSLLKDLDSVYQLSALEKIQNHKKYYDEEAKYCDEKIWQLKNDIKVMIKTRAKIHKKDE